MSKTKIIATVGPACNTPEKLWALVQAGVNVFRLNFSHGTHEEKLGIINMVRDLNDKYNQNIAIIADIQGPKLRIGEVENNLIILEKDDVITFTNEKKIGNKDEVYISYPNFNKDVKAGDTILLDDGKLDLKVTEVFETGKVKARVEIGGELSSKKGVNLPNTKISLPCLTEKDLADVEFCIQHDVDWIALSFVRKPKDIKDLREILVARGSLIKIIAKIEKPEAVESITEIVREADAVMVARGDLGVELPVEMVPMVQKTIIRKCIHRAKPVIIATQMMESMMDRTKPNRSEITDVANAVLDGADAVMLSGETAVGKYPELVVKTMRKITDEVEKEETVYHKNLIPMPHSPTFLSDALCYNACKISDDVDAKALIGMTRSGYTAFMLSSFRPKSNIYIFSDRKSVLNRLSLCWGVQSYYYDKFVGTDETIKDVQEILTEKGMLNSGDICINTGTMPLNEQGLANMLKITKIQ